MVGQGANITHLDQLQPRTVRGVRDRSLPCRAERPFQRSGTTPMISTLIVDDDEDMRLLARTTIERANHGLCVIGEAASGVEALAAVGETEPTVIVMDHNMPGMSGTETAALIRRTHPNVRVVLWTAFLSPRVVSEAESAGIHAYLDKGQIARIPDVVRQAAI